MPTCELCKLRIDYPSDRSSRFSEGRFSSDYAVADGWIRFQETRWLCKKCAEIVYRREVDKMRQKG